jgi:hypothetical protein
VFTDFSEFYPFISGDSAEAVTLQPDGRIIVAGTATPERYRFDFAVARYFGDPVAAAAPTPVRAFSRKLHNGVAFDIELPLNGRGIECRRGDHQVFFVFNEPVSVGGAAIQGSGTVSRFTGSGSEIAVDITGAANGETITINLNNVSNGSATGNVSVRMGTLWGDVNGSGGVNASDVSQTKAQSGQSLSASNFRTDVNASGATNATDIGIVRAQSGTALAP